VHPYLKPSFRHEGIKRALNEDPKPRLPVRHFRLPPRATLKNSPFWEAGWSRLVVCYRRFGKPYRSLGWLHLNDTLNYQLTLRKSKVRPRTGHEDPEGEQMHSYTVPSTSAPDGVGSQRHAPAALPPGKTRYPQYRRLGGPQDRAGRVRKNLASTGIRCPDRPARIESLYRLRYPSPSTYST
jgi:hypothetical protein